jgi:hypothetical protein
MRVMSRDVKEVLRSGHLTKAERKAIDFEVALEANEEMMGEGAAMAVTCDQFGMEVEDHPYVLIELPDGDWWEAAKLPVRGKHAA